MIEKVIERKVEEFERRDEYFNQEEVFFLYKMVHEALRSYQSIDESKRPLKYSMYQDWFNRLKDLI